MEALNAALDYHCASPNAWAEVWSGSVCLCTSGEIIQVCQREQIVEAPLPDLSNAGYVVIRENNFLIGASYDY